MSTPSYAVAGLVLTQSATFSAQAQDLQRDLRSLGYGKGPIDGVFGPGTAKSIEALQYDLMNNNGASSSGDGSASVAVTSYNNGSVTALTGVLDQGLVGCIEAMLTDPAFPKLPSSANPTSDNQNAIEAVKAISPAPVPIPFLMSILMQESACMHFQVSRDSNRDSFVTVGTDTNNAAAPAQITSRGYGMGQFTLFHHPPTAQEVATFISDPAQNVSQAVAELKAKFDNEVNGATGDTQADDRIAEVGRIPLRACQHPVGDARYMTGCADCMTAATLVNIAAGVTPVYKGATVKGAAEDYGKTQYHAGSYQNVPVRANIPCDWAYAVRRYNGGGVDSYDYQAEVLQRMVPAGG